MDTTKFFILALIIIVACVYGVYMYGVLVGPGEENPLSSQALSQVEIRDYHGEKLSSVTDFRENSIKGPQKVNISSYRLEITGLVNTPVNLSYDEVTALPQYQKVITLHCVEGWDATVLWEGPEVTDLLRLAGPLPMANTVIFYAADGYSTSLPLEYVRDHHILLASKMNNVTLPVERGYPFQLVAENEWGYKWIRWVTRIELSDNPQYRGYWERRGYSNTGDINGSFFD